MYSPAPSEHHRPTSSFRVSLAFRTSGSGSGLLSSSVTVTFVGKAPTVVWAFNLRANSISAWAVGWPAGCVVLFVHFAKTRASLRGVNLGVMWAVALYCAAAEAPERLVPAVVDLLQL